MSRLFFTLGISYRRFAKVGFNECCNTIECILFRKANWVSPLLTCLQASMHHLHKPGPWPSQQLNTITSHRSCCLPVNHHKARRLHTSPVGSSSSVPWMMVVLYVPFCCLYRTEKPITWWQFSGWPEISKVGGKSHGAYCNMYLNLLRFISTLWKLIYVKYNICTYCIQRHPSRIGSICATSLLIPNGYLCRLHAA